MENTTEEKNFDSVIKPLSLRKSRSKIKRGSLRLCLVLSPGEKSGEFINLRQEESLLINKEENQKFIITAAPALDLSYKGKSYPVYVCDSQKGVTVDVSFERETGLASLYCDPRMVSNVFDLTFISRASNIKADWKQLVAIACFSVVFGGLIGLMF